MKKNNNKKLGLVFAYFLKMTHIHMMKMFYEEFLSIKFSVIILGKCDQFGLN